MTRPPVTRPRNAGRGGAGRALPAARLAAALFLVAAVLFTPGVFAEEGGDWSPLLIARFGDIDAIDAEDGQLADFLRGVRNDGRFTPPMRSLVGPEIRNPTFFGITFEAWMECVLLVPPASGGVERLWVFPVENRDEYMTQLAGLGLSEYEGMDGVTILRETDAGGNVRIWHMEWLPGNVAVFGASRGAVASARELYVENSAARGLLAGAGGSFTDPDVLLRLYPPVLAAWQAGEPGNYWWREKIDRLTSDLIAYWQPTPARAQLIRTFADALALWPKGVPSADLGVWLEEGGVEWTLTAQGKFPDSSRSQLSVMRRVPDRAALAWAVPLTPAAVADFGREAGDFILAAAGGVVTQEAREEAREALEVWQRGNMREAAFAWVPPPAGTPELGACRLVIMDWGRPEAADAVWDSFGRLTRVDSALAQVFTQLGLRVEFLPEGDAPQSADAVFRPAAPGGAPEPYSHSTVSMRRAGNLVALAVGVSRDDPELRRRVTAYRAGLAEQAVSGDAAGGPDVREAFTRAGSSGAGFLGFLEPVRFLQLCFIESGDWRPRTPDQPEPPSTQLAREMLEYDSGRAWTAAGECSGGTWRVGGGIAWASLFRLAAALGLTEVIGTE